MRTSPVDASAATPAPGRRDRPVVVGLLVTVFVLAVVVTAARNPDGVVSSADPGYAPTPVPLLLVPAVLAAALTLLLPRGSGSARIELRRPRATIAETAALLVAVIGFPLLVPVLPQPEDYVLLKAVLFLLLPCLGLWWSARRRGASVEVRRPQVRWWIPVLPALTLGVLASIGPFSGGGTDSWPPLVPLLVAATATAITAGIGEEIMYRRFVQTRLEGLLGPWSGLLTASLLFGLMHAFSHGGGALWENALQVVALQGTTGIALGMIWARWRRLWVCVLAHLLLNGLSVLLHVGEVVMSAP